MMLHDLIKIRLVDMGYLPNYPYHMISDAEMCNAFMDCRNPDPGAAVDPDYPGSGMFFDYYPLLDRSDSDLSGAYGQLVLTIQYYLLCMQYGSDRNFKLPDWIYSYMLGSTISVYSDKLDIHDLIYPLGVDNIDDDFNADSSRACLSTSYDWINRTQSSSYIKADTTTYPGILEELGRRYVYGTALSSIYFSNQSPGVGYGWLISQPPTMFGDPDVVKSIRLSQASLGR